MAGSIEGQVLNQRDGQAIEGASLTLNGEGVEKQETSGEDGAFRFADLEAGKYEITARKEGFENGIYGPIAVIDGGPTTLNLGLQPKA